MRKLTALLLALVLAAAMYTVAPAETADYAATWTLTEMQVGDVAVDPAQLGMDMTISLEDGGLCTVTLTGVTQQCTWAAVEGGVVITEPDGAQHSLAASAEGLTLTIGDTAMLFTPAATPAEPQYITILSGLSIADFNGAWAFTHVQTSYETYSAAQLGMSMAITLADGSAVIQMASPEGTTVYQALCTTQETTLGTALLASIVDPDTGEPDGSGLILLRLSNGALAWYDYDSSTGTAYYYCFSPAAQ